MPRRSRIKPGNNLLQAFRYCNHSPVAKFTNYMADLLSLVFCDPPYKVKKEWRPMLREEVRANSFRARRIMYSPAIDLAVGPFATDRQYIEEYNQMVNCSANILNEMLRCFKRNLRRFQSSFRAPALAQLCSLNPNSRCFLAIEIERGNPSMKYLLGSTFNASSLGRIGIVVAWDQCRLDDLLRGREYFLNLANAGKNSFNTNNLIILDKDQLARTLERTARAIQRIR